MSKYHNDAKDLPKEAGNWTLAIDLLKSQIDSIKEYNDQINKASHLELQSIMEANRDQEIESFARSLEWIRKNMPIWDEELRKHLFEAELNNDRTGDRKDIGIGDLK